MAIQHVPWYRRFLNSVLSLFGVSYASFRAPTVCLQLCISCQPGASRSYQLGLTPPYLISSTGIVCRRHQWEYITIFTSPHGDKISHFMRSSTFCRGNYLLAQLPEVPEYWSSYAACHFEDQRPTNWTYPFVVAMVMDKKMIACMFLFITGLDRMCRMCRQSLLWSLSSHKSSRWTFGRPSRSSSTCILPTV